MIEDTNPLLRLRHHVGVGDAFHRELPRGRVDRVQGRREHRHVDLAGLERRVEGIGGVEALVGLHRNLSLHRLNLGADLGEHRRGLRGRAEASPADCRREGARDATRS